MNAVELGVAALLLAWVPLVLWRMRVGIAVATATTIGTVALVASARWRWQLVPLGVAALVVAVVTLVRASDRAPRDLGRRAVGVAVGVLVVVSVLAGVLLPVPSLPLVDGPGPVGTTAFDLVDRERTSPSQRTDADDPRRITVQAWWPAASADGPRLAITDDGSALAQAAGDFLGLPAFALGHLDAIRTAAHVDAPPAATERLPVVLSLHGWGGFRFAQAQLLEQLAADGHLVLAVDHTHGAVAAQPVAGGVVPIDESLLPDDAPPAEYAAASTVLEDLFRGDAVTVLDALREVSRQVPDVVHDLADLDRVVLVGHSTGGGAAVWACGQHPGCDGALTFDPWVEPLPSEVRADPLAEPWLSVLSEGWVGNDNDAVLRPLVAAAPRATVVAIEGTGHRDVTVQPLLSPLTPLLGLAGDLDKQRVDELALALSRAFLAEVLGSGPGDPTLLEDPPDEVVVDP